MRSKKLNMHDPSLEAFAEALGAAAIFCDNVTKLAMCNMIIDKTAASRVDAVLRAMNKLGLEAGSKFRQQQLAI